MNVSKRLLSALIFIGISLPCVLNPAEGEGVPDPDKPTRRYTRATVTKEAEQETKTSEATIGSMITSGADKLKKMSYDDSEVGFEFMFGPAPVRFGFGWGDSRSGSVVKKFPKFTVFWKVGTETEGMIAKGALDIGKIATADRVAEADVAADIMELEGKTEQEDPKDILAVLGTIERFTDKPHPYMQYAFRMFLLFKDAWKKGAGRSLLEKIGTKRDVRQSQQLMSEWFVLREVIRLTLRLLRSTHAKKINHRYVLQSKMIPDSFIRTLDGMSQSLGKEPRYLYDTINTIWREMFRYTDAFKEGGYVEGIGPSVYGVRFPSWQLAEKYKTICAGAKRSKDLPLDVFLKKYVKLKKAFTKDANYIKELEKIDASLTSDKDYRYFGLVDSRSEGVPREITDLAAVVRQEARDDGYPQIRNIQLKDESGRDQYWVVQITDRYNALESFKLISAALFISMQDYAKGLEKALDAKMTEAEQRLKEEAEKAGELHVRVARNVKRFLERTKGNLAQSAKAAVEFNKRRAALRTPAKDFRREWKSPGLGEMGPVEDLERDLGELIEEREYKAARMARKNSATVQIELAESINKEYDDNIDTRVAMPDFLLSRSDDVASALREWVTTKNDDPAYAEEAALQDPKRVFESPKSGTSAEDIIATYDDKLFGGITFEDPDDLVPAIAGGTQAQPSSEKSRLIREQLGEVIERLHRQVTQIGDVTYEILYKLNEQIEEKKAEIETAKGVTAEEVQTWEKEKKDKGLTGRSYSVLQEHMRDVAEYKRILDDKRFEIASNERQRENEEIGSEIYEKNKRQLHSANAEYMKYMREVLDHAAEAYEDILTKELAIIDIESDDLRKIDPESLEDDSEREELKARQRDLNTQQSELVGQQKRLVDLRSDVTNAMEAYKPTGEEVQEFKAEDLFNALDALQGFVGAHVDIEVHKGGVEQRLNAIDNKIQEFSNYLQSKIDGSEGTKSFDTIQSNLKKRLKAILKRSQSKHLWLILIRSIAPLYGWNPAEVADLIK